MSAGVPARVLFAELNEDGTVGGSHRCLHDLVRHLDRDRFDPVVLFYQANPFVERIAALGAHVVVWEAERTRERGAPGWPRLPRAAARTAAAVARRVQLLRTQRVDLVHLNNSPFHGVEDWLPAARIGRRPIVSHCRAAAPADGGGFRGRLARRFDRIVSISAGVTRSLRAAGVAAPRIAEIHDGLDLAALRAAVRSAPADVRARLGVAPGRTLVVMVGHLRAWKGQDVLLAALASLAPEPRKRFHVALVGEENPLDADYARRLRGRVASPDLEGIVSLLGQRDDVADLMNAADVVVHASTIPEPFGLVVVEAMALGRAVVASALGGPSETVVPGSGILFDPSQPVELAAHLVRLADDEPLRRALGERGRARAEAFDILAHVRALEALYDEVLARPRAA
jgi:glycosyltransferase involved in cell wall biosynthesis